jgi:hypothetical protein
MLLEDYAADLAKQMGVKLSKVSVETSSDCNDASLLLLEVGRKLVSVLVYRSDLDELKRRKRCERLKNKITVALESL